METISIIPHYSQHLKNDSVKGTKENQLQQLIDILGLIAKVNDRIQTIREHCKIMWGLSSDGKIRGTDSDIAKLVLYRSMLLRLKGYYNFKLGKLYPFGQAPVKLRNEPFIDLRKKIATQ